MFSQLHWQYQISTLILLGFVFLMVPMVLIKGKRGFSVPVMYRTCFDCIRRYPTALKRPVDKSDISNDVIFYSLRFHSRHVRIDGFVGCCRDPTTRNNRCNYTRTCVAGTNVQSFCFCSFIRLAVIPVDSPKVFARQRKTNKFLSNVLSTQPHPKNS